MAASLVSFWGDIALIGAMAAAAFIVWMRG